MTKLEFASDALAAVKTGVRDNGNSYYYYDVDAYRDMCHAAHDDGMLPDDHVYEYIVRALEALIDNDMDIDASIDVVSDDTDVYTHDLLSWVSSNLSRVKYVDDAISSDCKDLITAMQYGQSTERQDVLTRVYTWIDDNIWED